MQTVYQSTIKNIPVIVSLNFCFDDDINQHLEKNGFNNLNDTQSFNYLNAIHLLYITILIS